LARNVFEYHAVLGYRFIPGIVARIPHEGGGYTVRANSSGFNCPHEVTAEKPPDTFRIVLFGDSYTAGDGVSVGYRYGDLLEAEFERAQVLNFGLPGSGTDQQYLAFREFAAPIDYDLMIISPMVENIRRNLRPFSLTIRGTDGRIVRRAKPYFKLIDGHLELCQVPVPREVVPVTQQAIGELVGEIPPGRMKRAIRAVYRKMPFLYRLLMKVRRVRSPIEYEDSRNPAWLLMKAMLTRWIRESRAPVIVCAIPTFSHIDRSFAPGGYLRRFAELDAETIDLLPEFWKLPGRERRRCRFINDDHPTRLGHQVIARGLLPHVRRHYKSWEQQPHAAGR
jgi:hypothetical protein